MLQFEILTNLQKDQRLVQIEHMPQLRLAPPAVYHERVKKGTDIFTGESSNGLAKIEKQSKSKQLRELRVKGSSLRFPLKSSIFGELCYKFNFRVTKILWYFPILTYRKLCYRQGEDQQAVMQVSCIEHTGDDEDHFGWDFDLLYSSSFFFFVYFHNWFVYINFGGLGCCICLYLRVKLYMNHGEALVMKLK